MRATAIDKKKTSSKYRNKNSGVQSMKKDDLVKILNCYGFDYMHLMAKPKKELQVMAEEYLEHHPSENLNGFEQIEDIDF